MNSLDGPAQFTLLALLTEMIAYYAKVLSLLIGKRIRGKKVEKKWHVNRIWVMNVLKWTLFAMVADSVFLSFRIVSAFVFSTTATWVDGSIVCLFLGINIAMAVVFLLSYGKVYVTYKDDDNNV